MRYFVSKNGLTVVEKQAVEGEDSKIDFFVNQYKSNHPNLVVTELDQATFDVTALVIPQTQAQKDWATLKASSPTALQIATFFARYLGLE